MQDDPAFGGAIAAAGGALTNSNTTTQTSAELVKITGIAGQTALDVAAGNTTFAGATSLAGLFHLTSVQTVTHASGAGNDEAIPITATVTLLESAAAGGDSFTLADGAPGQMMIIIYKTKASGTGAEVIPASISAPGATGVNLPDAGHTVSLLFTNSSWYVIGGWGFEVGSP